MIERVYHLSDIPIEKAASLGQAVGDIDQRQLLRLLRRRRRYSRRSLRTLVEHTIAQNAVQAVKGRLPDGSIGFFVNRKTFPAEFSAFLHQVANGEACLSASKLHNILQDGQRGRRNYRRRVLRYIYSIPLFIRIAERFFRDLDEVIMLAEISRFSPCQKHMEIRSLLNFLGDDPPKTVLEIGTSRGGSFYLLTKVADSAARLATIDLHMKNKKLLKSFARKQQRITLIEADSTAAETIATIRDIFPEGLDFVFIDGDHSYERVKKDFDNYFPFVRPGGKIAFHDIVEDNDTRYGVFTGRWSGGVPAFWLEVRNRFRHVEFIDNPEQDGHGIGVLFIPQTGAGATKTREK